MQNRAAVLHGVRDLRIEDIPVPQPRPREVLVEVRAVGVCGSDVHYYEHGRAGRYDLCPDVRFFATPPIDGAFCNYLTIQEDFAFALPDGASDDAGAMMEPLSVGIWACRKAHLQGGEHVLVTGAGPIGLLAMQAALALGATQVTIADVNPYRLELAERTGATAAIDLREQPLGEAGVEADVLLECSGHPVALADGIRALRPAGVAVAVGMGPGEEAAVPLALLQNREITLTGIFRYANAYPTAIELVATGWVDVEAIVTGHFGLEQAEQALQAGGQDPHSVKAVVVPAGATT